MDVLSAVLSEFAALDVDEQAVRANELSGRFERDLYSLSGLTEALGGADAVDRSITETADWYGTLGGQVTIPDSNSPMGFRRPAAATSNPTSVGEGLFGGPLVTMLGAEAAVSATNDGAEGSKDLGQDNPTRKPDPNDAKINITAKNFQTNAAVCNVLEPFTLSGGGFSVSFSAGPTGTYNYSDIFSASGNGGYVITLPDGPGKPGTMIGSGPGVIAGTTGSGTETYTLTPITC